MKIMKVDPGRIGHGQTGIFVRAEGPSGGFGSYDIAELDKDSLFSFLRSRGGENLWAENTVSVLLGHGNFLPELDDPEKK